MENALLSNDPNELVKYMTKCIHTDGDGNDIGSSDADNKKYIVLKDLLQRCIVSINKNIADSIKSAALSHNALAATAASASDVGISISSTSSQLLIIEDAQFLEPRGRYKVTITLQGILMEGKTISSYIPWSLITDIACVPSNVSTKKEGEDILAIYLGENTVTVNSKGVKNFVWILSKNMAKVYNAMLSNDHSSSSSNGSTQDRKPTLVNGNESAVVCQLCQYLLNRDVDVPRANLFTTVTTSKPFLRCHKGIQEGALYPLRSGVIFLKPLLYIAADEIAAISAGRGGGSGTTRYVDLTIETIDGKVHEFTNIEREDLPAIQHYVKGYLESRSRKVKVQNEESVSVIKGGGSEAGDGDDHKNVKDTAMIDDDDDDEDDDDFNPDSCTGSDEDSDDSGSNSSNDSDNGDGSDTEESPQKKSRPSEDENGDAAAVEIAVC